MIIGTISRLLFGLEHQLWNQAPDQIAWELNLQELFANGNWSYDRLIHYPHEGGTILISLVSLLFKPFAPFHSLVISAFTLDIVFRFIQLAILKRVAGNKSMIIYGLLSMGAVPLLISWGGINYGLHAISATFPFALIYLLFREHNSNKSYIQDGLFLGLSGWFLYSNFLFIPVYFLFLLYKKSKLKHYLLSASTLLLVILAHLLVRSMFDPGFHLSSFDATSIRGEEFELFNLDSYTALLSIWTGAVRESSLLVGNAFMSTNAIRWSSFILMILGIVMLIHAIIKQKVSSIFIFGILAVIAYVSAYSVSPFCIVDSTRANYVFSRHLAYVYPFLMALSIIGFVAHKRLIYLTIPLILISIQGFVMHQKSPKSDAYLIRPTGWVLIAKFGHDPNRLTQILSSSGLKEEDKTELKIGLGWGLGTTLFQGLILDDSTKVEVDSRTVRLMELLNEFPIEYQSLIKEGVEFSFSDQVTPLLDKRILTGYISPKMEAIIESGKQKNLPAKPEN